MSQARLIALDWGTTALRGWLVDGQGSVSDHRQARAGVLAVPQDGFESAFTEFFGPWRSRHGAVPAIACGMIGSRQGWREAPYAPCPCAPPDLPPRLMHVGGGGRALAIVPG